MTRISFYVGKSNALQARFRLACKVLEKAQMQALNTYIHLDSAASCQQLDTLIWTYHDLSFIPHTLAPHREDGVRVQLGYDHEPMADCDLLINLSNEIPEFFARFVRMAEIIDQEADILHAGRKRYQFYRDRGYNLDYYQL
ncbi:MAG: DNA polymerase III subunit chi [Thiothrix nivea]|nr:MAG: DNA polymerase III subunit chi [Thiothrix nivea]